MLRERSHQCLKEKQSWLINLSHCPHMKYIIKTMHTLELIFQYYMRTNLFFPKQTWGAFILRWFWVACNSNAICLWLETNTLSHIGYSLLYVFAHVHVYVTVMSIGQVNPNCKTVVYSSVIAHYIKKKQYISITIQYIKHYMSHDSNSSIWILPRPYVKAIWHYIHLHVNIDISLKGKSPTLYTKILPY